MPSAPLHVGTGVHLGLAEMARGNEWRKAVDLWSAEAMGEFVESYQARVGCLPSTDEFTPYTDSLNLVLALLGRYQARYRDNLFGLSTLQPLYVEQAFKVAIPGTIREFFVGTWDAVLEDQETGELWIVEHKTYTRQSNVY